MKKFNKLVRDHIPEIIVEKYQTKPKTRVLSMEEFSESLNAKLIEETKEFLENPNLEELADILEVVHALSRVHGSNPQELEEFRKNKTRTNGAFEKKIFLEYVE